mmetsp:Transcript_28221/g.83107  ORF Transcript_28221/g.83107 Transcript_28221/m.83107 type:complete len:343 (-) Transcript_28221:1977-3005(-)
MGPAAGRLSTHAPTRKRSGGGLTRRTTDRPASPSAASPRRRLRRPSRPHRALRRRPLARPRCRLRLRRRLRRRCRSARALCSTRSTARRSRRAAGAPQPLPAWRGMRLARSRARCRASPPPTSEPRSSRRLGCSSRQTSPPRACSLSTLGTRCLRQTGTRCAGMEGSGGGTGARRRARTAPTPRTARTVSRFGAPRSATALTAETGSRAAAAPPTPAAATGTSACSLLARPRRSTAASAARSRPSTPRGSFCQTEPSVGHRPSASTSRQRGSPLRTCRRSRFLHWPAIGSGRVPTSSCGSGGVRPRPTSHPYARSSSRARDRSLRKGRSSLSLGTRAPIART